MENTSKEEEIKQEFEIIVKKLNLREETVSGVDEIGMVWNFILKIRQEALTEQKMKFKEMVEKLKQEKIKDVSRSIAMAEYKSAYCEALYDLSELTNL